MATATGKPRRTQAERSTGTRSKIILATIDCLCRLGSPATSVLLVAERAGVSRGAMMHHFPTRTDLMLAVMRHVFEDHLDHYRRVLGPIKDPMERFVRVADEAWELHCQPGAIAAMEITLATRSDPQLAKALAPLSEEIERHSREGHWEIAEAAGFTNRDEVEARRRLFIAAARSLAIDLALERDPAGPRAALALLKRHATDLMTNMQTGAASAGPPQR